MTKTLVVFLMIFCAPFIAIANTEYYTDEANAITDYADKTIENIKQDYDDLYQIIQREDPKYASKMNMPEIPESTKITMARSWFAKKAFDYYYETFLKDLEQRSKETRRQVITDTWGDDTERWTESKLDRGRLDSQDCRNIEGDRICKYPDGFEDFHISLREYNIKNAKVKAFTGNNDWTKIMYYYKDIPDKNATQHCEVRTTYKSDGSSTLYENYILQTSCDIRKYDEFHTWRNQEIEDTINGKHGIIGKDVLPNGKVLEILQEKDAMSDWKSNDLPDGVVVNRINSFRQSISKGGTE